MICCSPYIWALKPWLCFSALHFLGKQTENGPESKHKILKRERKLTITAKLTEDFVVCGSAMRGRIGIREWHCSCSRFGFKYTQIQEMESREGERERERDRDRAVRVFEKRERRIRLSKFVNISVGTCNLEREVR